MPAAALILPALLVPRLRRLLPAALALLAGALAPPVPASSALQSVFPDGARLIRVEGVVTRGPDIPRGGRTFAVMRVDAVSGRAVEGRVLVLLPAGSPLPSPGARAAATGRLIRPRDAANPGERSSREALSARGITHLLAVASPGSFRVLEPSPLLTPAALVHRARLGLDHAVHRIPDDLTSRLLACLLLGRRDRLPPELAAAFRRTGTVHFLAISGLHVGIVAGILWLLARAVPLPRTGAGILVAGAAVAYAAVTGMRPPVFRASLLVSLAVLGPAFRRRPRPLHLLSVAAIVILLVDPGDLFRTGFLLSFAAVLAIHLLSRPFEEGLFWRQKLLQRFSVPRARPWPLRAARRYLMKGLPVALSAWLGTAPLVLLRFGTFPLLAVPANLMVLPVVTLLVPAGFLAAATGSAFPADLLSHALAGLVLALARVPFSSFTLPPPPWPAVVGFYAFLLAASRRRTLGAAWAALAVLGLGALAASGAALRSPPREPVLTVLSVGSGLCAVLETPEGGVLVYDVGSRRPRVFERTVLPFLRARGVTGVDALVLSHGDIDHVSGAADLEAALPVGRRHGPGELCRGDRFRIPGARIEVLWPPDGHAGGNDGSTVLLVRAGGLTALLTGDLEEQGIRGLLGMPGLPRPDVLLLPHHGRPSPAAAELVEGVGAEVLLVSNGASDPLDPAYAGARLTSVEGAIEVRPGPDVRAFRPSPPAPPPRRAHRR